MLNRNNNNYDWSVLFPFSWPSYQGGENDAKEIRGWLTRIYC